MSVYVKMTKEKIKKESDFVYFAPFLLLALCSLKRLSKSFVIPV